MRPLWLLIFSLCTMLFLANCGVPSGARTPDIIGLSTGIAALDPSVDADEAQRMAEIAYRYTLELRAAYNVTDGALLHNTKVNQGLRPRGLCWHWADDLEARLRQEGFESLTLHRAIANHDTIRIEHSTVIVSAKGAAWHEGIVLDPWRYGGYLFWAPVPEDKRYAWEERSRVFEIKAARRAQSAAR